MSLSQTYRVLEKIGNLSTRENHILSFGLYQMLHNKHLIDEKSLDALIEKIKHEIANRKMPTKEETAALKKELEED
jgi:hypothetical protein